jgi:hypothetical protein
MRRFVLFLVLAGIFWQAMGVAGRGALASAGEDVAHVLMHWSESAHHHHDDGSFARDDSDDAVRHVLSDNALTAPALCFALSMNFGEESVPRPGDALSVYLPAPFPDRLRRPPRTTA